MWSKYHNNIIYTIIDLHIYYKLILARIKNLKIRHIDHRIFLSVMLTYKQLSL